MLYCTVILNSKSPAIADGLTYASNDNIKVGMLVTVPIRRSTSEGIVIDVSKNKPKSDFDIKYIKEVINTTPLLSSNTIKTAKWIADEYFCSIRQALQPFLPSKKWTNLLPKNETFVCLTDPDKTEPNKKKFGKRQLEVIDYLRDEDWVSLAKLRRDINTSIATLKKMEEAGIILFEERSENESEHKLLKFLETPNLSPNQQIAYEEIIKSNKPSLLFGITSSGKTEIYAKLIGYAVTNGKQAILLVPEILLTEQNIVKFQERLSPERIAVVHSRLTPSERRNIWRDCKAGRKDLVIGSRSALFSPLNNLGIIIIDEEHEWTYKNEQTPRYHARSTAIELAKHSNSILLLGSATPSLESWALTKESTFNLVKLNERYQNQPYPNVSIVDLGDTEFNDAYPFSHSLLTAIEETLNNKEQSILFLNRRGLASSLICLTCRRRIVSPESQLPFTVHRRRNGAMQLVDHTTNLKIDAPTQCPHCKSVAMRAIGAGTQKIEDVLSDKFPRARLLRADSDTLSNPNDMRALLSKMQNKEADILFGTQSVIKGLDIPNVTLAAVLLADIGLSLPHFRSGERIFQALTQLTGRSGRFKPGKVIIQTFRPSCPEVIFSAKHKTEEYLNTEFELRKKLDYPPSNKMVRLIFRKPYPERRASEVFNVLNKIKSENRISCSPTLFGGGNVWHILIRGENPKSLLNNIDLLGAVVDIDPVECI